MKTEFLLDQEMISYWCGSSKEEAGLSGGIHAMD